MRVLNIPYISPLDRRVHKYFSDFIIKVRESTGEIKTYVIEVKPKKQTKPPAKRKKVSQSYIYECKTWEVNKAKWKVSLLNFVLIEELNLRSSQKTNSGSNESYQTNPQYHKRYYGSRGTDAYDYGCT